MEGVLTAKAVCLKVVKMSKKLIVMDFLFIVASKFKPH